MPADPARVKDLFAAALGLPDPAARRAFLDRECGADAGLRRRLDQLLAAHDHPESALDRPLAAATDPDGPRTAPHRPAAPTPGRSSAAGTSCWRRSARAGWARCGWRTSWSRSAAASP